MNETNLPEPLTPSDCDVSDLEWFAFHHARLHRSDWWARASDLARSRSVDLWCVAWQQIPAGSLPNNDVALAGYASFGRDADAWRMSATEILEPWILCSDGRWYHPTICEVALEAWELKQDAEARRDADAKRKREARKARKSKHDAIKRGRQKTSTGHPQDIRDASDECPSNVRSITKTKTDNPCSPQDTFENVWSKWPKRGRERSTKAKARAALKAASSMFTPSDILRAVSAYVHSKDARKDDGEYVPGLHTWLREKLETWIDLSGTTPAAIEDAKPEWFLKLATRFEDSDHASDWKEIWSRFAPVEDGNPVVLRAPSDGLYAATARGRDRERFAYVVGRPVKILPPEKPLTR